MSHLVRVLFILSKNYVYAKIKVLIELFQKFAGQGQRPCRCPQTSEHPRLEELRRGESDKTIRWIVFQRGGPCDRGHPCTLYTVQDFIDKLKRT